MSKSRTPKAFDLSSRYMAETLVVPITDPTDVLVDTGMTWTIASQFSDRARQAALALPRPKLGTDGTVEAGDPNADPMLEQLVAVTVAWEGFTVNGEPVPCTPKNVRKLLTDPRTAWLRPQVQIAYLQLGRFFGDAKPTLSTSPSTTSD